MAINLLELPDLPRTIQGLDWVHVRGVVDGDSLDFRIRVSNLLYGVLTEANVNNSIGGLVALINDGSGNAALPAVSGAFLTNVPLPTATGSVLGGVRLLDSTTSTSGVGGGYAATPLSVRTVDLRVSNLTASQVASVAGGTLAATNVQAALNELRDDKLEASNGVAYDSARLGGNLASTFLRSGVATASQIVNVPFGTIQQTTVQAALNELEQEKLSTTGTAANSSQLGGFPSANFLRSGVATASQIVNTPANGIVGATVQLAIDWLGANKLSTSNATAANISAQATSTTLAGTVQSALAELASEKLQISNATATNIVNAPNTGTGGSISATNVQTALNGLDTSKLSITGTAYDSARLGGNLASTFLRSGVATAANIVNVEASGITGTNVQAALNWLGANKLNTSSATAANISAQATSTTAAGTVQSALAELASEKLEASNGVAYDSTRLGGRPASDYMLTTGTPAGAIVVTPYTNPSGNGNIVSTDLQSALQELVDEKLPVTGTAANSSQLGGFPSANFLRSGVATASQIVNVPSGNIQQATVQLALNELDSEKLSITGTAYDSARLGGNLASTFLRSGVATAANIVNVETAPVVGTNLQSAINWLGANKLNISAATAANITAAATTTTNAGSVQSALAELASEKLEASNGTAYDSARLGGYLGSTFLRSGVATAANVLQTNTTGTLGTTTQTAIDWLYTNKFNTASATASNITAAATTTTNAGTVQSALAELASEKLQISDAIAANIPCGATTTTAALNVQDALAELASEKLQASNGVAYDSARLGGVLASNYLQSGAVLASGVTFVAYPAGGISSTTVQAAIQELADDKLSINGITINLTSGNYRVAIGDSAGFSTQSSYAVALGSNAGNTGQGLNGVAVGAYSGASNQGFDGVAVGYASGQTSQGSRGIAIGSGAGNTNQGTYTTAIGYLAGYRSQGSRSIAIGDRAGADPAVTTLYQMDYSVAVGANAYTANSVAGTDGYATAVGYAANASGVGAVALGRDSEASGVNSFAALQDSTASTAGSIAIGGNAQATAINGIAIGLNSEASGSGNSSTAIGSGSRATSGSTVSVGYNSLSSGGSSIAVGVTSNATGVGAIAIGLAAAASASSSTTVGYQATTSAAQSTAIGANSGSSNTTYTNSTSVGYQATVTGANQVQLGNSATVVYTYATGVRSVSDIRDKADIRDTELGLNFIQALRPVQYRWDYRSDYKEDPSQSLSEVVKDGSKKRKRFHNGLIAQEVEQVCANLNVDFAGLNHAAVTGGEDTYSIGYEELIAPMIKAIQELSVQVEDLKQQLNKPSKKR